MITVFVCLLASLMVNPVWSPDSTRIAYTEGGDLYVKNTSDGTVRRITDDGSDVILNGFASWVYYEEVLGRSSEYKAFWWSPDSGKLAFYRFDNSRVPEFPIFSPFGKHGSMKTTRYPKAGDDNPGVRLGIADVSTGEVLWVPFTDGDLDVEGGGAYFGTPFWGPDSKRFFVPCEPRRQNRLELFAVSVEDGSRSVVYSESTDTWLDFPDNIVFTDKGLYMARDFETLWQQIYFLSYDGSEFKCLTSGKNWAISILRVDEKRGDIWFTAKRDSRTRPSLYRLDRKGRIWPLTSPEYWVSDVAFSQDGGSFTARVSNSSTPWMQVSGDSRSKKPFAPSAPVSEGLKDGAPGTGSLKDGASGTAVPDGPRPREVVINNDGYDLYGLMSLPRDFDPSKRYPVLMQLYGGPGTPYVRDRWADRDASDSWCWESGIIYIVVDPRSSGENGRKGLDEAFRRMTVIELQDYIAWARYLQGLPYVNASRIGVEGFSFGGTTTAMLVLRYPEYFCCGVAGGGVYDWQLYDSIYTERFMETPQSNPEGYAAASVLTYLKDSKVPEGTPSNLKLTHGTGDDNVHFQNTLLLMDALQKAGYQFELMLYPDGMHGYRGAQHTHDKASDHDFWTRKLLD